MSDARIASSTHDRWTDKPIGFVLERPEWMEHAECRGMDPEMFHPVGAAAGKAAAVCDTCPVRGDCLDFAIETRQRFGIWGGETERSRRRISRQRARERRAS